MTVLKAHILPDQPVKMHCVSF